MTYSSFKRQFRYAEFTNADVSSICRISMHQASCLIEKGIKCGSIVRAQFPSFKFVK